MHRESKFLYKNNPKWNWLYQDSNSIKVHLTSKSLKLNLVSLSLNLGILILRFSLFLSRGAVSIRKQGYASLCIKYVRLFSVGNTVLWPYKGVSISRKGASLNILVYDMVNLLLSGLVAMTIDTRTACHKKLKGLVFTQYL